MRLSTKILISTAALITAGFSAAAPTAGIASAQALRSSSGGALESEFYGVSCTSASACTAVGDDETSAGVSV